jgi:hypothetical protein
MKWFPVARLKKREDKKSIESLDSCQGDQMSFRKNFPTSFA